MTHASWRHQPFKAIYLSYELFSAFVRIPWWALVALPRSQRPVKSWTWRRTMHVKLVRRLTALSGVVGPLISLPDHRELAPGPGFDAVWVDPVPEEFVRGKLTMWASLADVARVKLPGYWMHKTGSKVEVVAPLAPGEKIVYALHGGAYTRLSAHPNDPTSGIARGLLQHVDTVRRTFAIEYRLSSTFPYPVANPFPTALLDALAGYHYLVHTLRIPPEDIIIDGDSAGGNLALALTRYLVEEAALPAPGALVLFSPWCDIGKSHASRGGSYDTCVVSDYLKIPRDGVHYSALAFTGLWGLGAANVNVYISPASLLLTKVSFEKWPRTLRTFVSAGGSEVLRDEVRTLVERMKRDMGDDRVRYLECEDGVHDFCVFDNGVHDPERTQTLQAVRDWLTEGSN
ncbi:Alpha/Beta hydrolase protein [Mycena maculata]|uniref:Alpha/Beta hydrolase protein n=1 Tax=Mycena maculata TaxID=230809 RepID=A0AAD7I2X2_9AGAR|nr:Alpha/Beta hydrolase protein [Mycena maculata]